MRMAKEPTYPSCILNYRYRDSDFAEHSRQATFKKGRILKPFGEIRTAQVGLRILQWSGEWREKDFLCRTRSRQQVTVELIALGAYRNWKRSWWWENADLNSIAKATGNDSHYAQPRRGFGVYFRRCQKAGLEGGCGDELGQKLSEA